MRCWIRSSHCCASAAVCRTGRSSANSTSMTRTSTTCKVEIIEVQQCARDQEGTMLVWTGAVASAATPEPVQAPALLTYTPPYLAEKILTSRSALEGERKQVT